MLKLDPPAWLALPNPISTNQLFSNVPGKGRVMTKKYATWKRVARQYLMAQGPLPKFGQPVSITLFVGEAGVGGMDADNTCKAYLDILKDRGVIHDDSKKWVRSVCPIWIKNMQGCVAFIAPAEEKHTKADVTRHLKPAGRELIE